MMQSGHVTTTTEAHENWFSQNVRGAKTFPPHIIRIAMHTTEPLIKSCSIFSLVKHALKLRMIWLHGPSCPAQRLITLSGSDKSEGLSVLFIILAIRSKPKEVYVHVCVCVCVEGHTRLKRRADIIHTHS